MVAQAMESGDEAQASLRQAVMNAGERWSDGQRELIRLVPELEASREWAIDGSPTCAHWIATALDVEVCTAREWLRIGRMLENLGLLRRAFEQERLSYSKVRTLTRVATAENEADLCALAERVPAGRLTHALAAWLARHETPVETDRRQHQARSMNWRLAFDGMIVGSFRLSPAEAARITEPLDALVVHRRPYGAGDASADAPEGGLEARWPSIAQQRADALVELVTGGGGTVATEIVMHVRGDGCTLDDGTPITESVVERIAPYSFLRALIHDAQSRPINASGRQRHPSARQRRVVKARDGRCVDCGSTELLQYDHDPDFAVSRHTLVDELALRCWPCHRARHKGTAG